MKLPAYPVHEIIPELRKNLSEKNIVILQAPPGAGKSTVLPLELLDESWLGEKKIIMLEPRRLAARSVAQRMADLLNEECGETIGYRIRFETKVSSKTRIEVVTEGILTRMLQNDNALEQYALVIFDEFHERNLNTDLSLALCLQSQQILRPELKLLIMSATLDGENISKKLNNAPVITSEGRQFPVSIIYTKENSEEPIHIQVSRMIRKALIEQKGDILAFLPGAGEILRTKEWLEENSTEAKIFPLYGDLNFSQQQSAILPDKHGNRKIILSTSIAETSLTIEGITTVVDCGFSRGSKFDVKSGLSKMETFKVSKDTADQRAGRAGRLGPGVCYRLWTEGSHLHLAPNRKPEIAEADLCGLMLELYNWGINDVDELTWITNPPAANISQAKDLLKKLDAIADDKITLTGKKLLKFPTHPRFAHMFMLAEEKDGVTNSTTARNLAADIASLLEERDPLERNSGCDIYTRLIELNNFRSKKFTVAEKRTLERIERLAASWRKILQIQPENSNYDEFLCGSLIAAAYPERIAKQLEKNKNLYRLANGKTAKLPEHDALINEEWIAVAHIDAAQKEGKIFLASSLKKEEVFKHASTKEKLEWDEREGKITASEETYFDQIIISSKPLKNFSEEQKNRIICEAIKKEGLQKFGWDEECDNWQARVKSIRIWNADQEWPDVSESALLENIDSWLPQWLGKTASREEIRKLNWNEISRNVLSWEMQNKLNDLAPEKISVPSGSNIKLLYFSDGKAPELHVRLQEVFGMTDTPLINNGKTKIVLHLLSPGYKPVQVTMDLKSFWNNAYHEVRKELQRRYPKHSWPENPLEAEAIRGPKKKK